MAAGVRRWLAVALALVVVGAATFLIITRVVVDDQPACDAPFAERIDPRSSQHVLPGTEVPTYLTNPPTSGAHRPGPPDDAVVDHALDKPAQVGILESGRVLVQYRDVGDDAEAKLTGLVRGRDDLVVVAPNRTMSSKIIATAWLFKMTCERFSAADLMSFIDAHAQKAPTH